jgi:hypothetical protein
MTKGKRGKEQTTIYKTIHREQKFEPHEPHKTPWWNWVAPEEQAVH